MKMVCRTHEGLVRINNEDCVHVDPEVGFAVVADGMGGLLAGEEASAVAVEAVCQALIDQATDCQRAEDVGALVKQAHQAVLAHARELHYEGKMGTTLVLWVQSAAGRWFSHVGDSRLYAWDGERLIQVTSDHTVAQRMIDMGQFPKEQAYRAPNRHVLTQALGLPGMVFPEMGAVPDAKRYLLCSDGLSDMVQASRLAEIIATPNLEECAEMFLKEALGEGGRDNVSLALIES